MIPKPKHLDTEHEFLIPMGKQRLIQFVASLPKGMTIDESRELLSGNDRDIHDLLTKHHELIAIGDGFLVRNPAEEHKHLPFIECSLFEASMWTYISIVWGMDFAHKMLLSQHPIEYQRKWATCHWCKREFAELAHPDSTLCDGMCSYQCYDQEYEHRHYGD